MRIQRSLKPLVYSGVLAALLMWRVSPAADNEARIEGTNIRLEFDHRMYSRLIARFGGKEALIGPFSASETVTADGAVVSDFTLQKVDRHDVHDQFGDGRQTTLTGNSGSLEKTMIVTTYDRFPEMVLFKVRYSNRGKADIRVTGWSPTSAGPIGSCR